jgi:hypothetical protein
VIFQISANRLVGEYRPRQPGSENPQAAATTNHRRLSLQNPPRFFEDTVEARAREFPREGILLAGMIRTDE